MWVPRRPETLHYFDCIPYNLYDGIAEPTPDGFLIARTRAWNLCAGQSPQREDMQWAFSRMTSLTVRWKLIKEYMTSIAIASSFFDIRLVWMRGHYVISRFKYLGRHIFGECSEGAGIDINCLKKLVDSLKRFIDLWASGDSLVKFKDTTKDKHLSKWDPSYRINPMT